MSVDTAVWIHVKKHKTHLNFDYIKRKSDDDLAVMKQLIKDKYPELVNETIKENCDNSYSIETPDISMWSRLVPRSWRPKIGYEILK